MKTIEHLTKILTEYDERNHRHFTDRLKTIYSEEVRSNMIREYQRSVFQDPFRKELQRTIVDLTATSTPPLSFYFKQN